MMAPRNPPRSYGSVEHDTKHSRPPPCTDSAAVGNNDSGNHSATPPRPRYRIGTETQPTQGPPSTGGTPTRFRRWAAVGVLVSGLALVAVTALVRVGVSATNQQADISISDAVVPGTTRGADDSTKLAEMPLDGGSASRPGMTTTLGGDRAMHAPNAEISHKGRISDNNVDALSFTALNFYHVRDGKPGTEYPWLKNKKLIEPFRETTLKVTSPREGYTYYWSVRSAEGNKDAGEVELSGLMGDEVEVKLTKLDGNLITLEEVDTESGVVMRRLDEHILVKYVRREIRTLTDVEREELFDAMLKLWTDKVQGGNGKELYGDDYADIWAINRLHYKAASPEPCDHFHDGLGFLTNHALLTNTFEYSLQKVNPKLTLPYWDFTIETSSAGGVAEGVPEPQAFSPVLQSSWFGGKDSVDHQVKDGRWAYTKIPKMKTNNPGGVDPDVYGHLRAPWNVNNRPYLTRGLGEMCGARVEDAYPWPTCESHYKLATEYRDFYSWVWYSLYDPHGPVHVWLGGTVDCKETYDKIGALIGKDRATELAYFSFVHRKNLYRDGIFKCEGTVDTSVSPGDVLNSGECGCLGYDFSQGDDYVAVKNTMAFLGNQIDDQPEDVQRKVVGYLCSGLMNDGDHLQASSSLDPSFWSTHPTMERLFMYSLLTGNVQDMHWADANMVMATQDNEVYEELISAYGETCMGHRGFDVFPFGLLENDTNDFKVRTGIRDNGDDGGNKLNNREVLQAFDPRQDKLSYIYDNFKWTHCADDGYDLDDAWGPWTYAKVSAETHAASATSGSGALYRVTEKKSGSAKMEKVAVKKNQPGGLKAEARASDGGVGHQSMMFRKGGPRYPRYKKFRMMEEEQARQQRGRAN